MTVTIVEPALVESCIDVAVTVAAPATDGASTPEDVMVPSVVFQVTAEL